MTGLIFAKTMSPTTIATVIAMFSRSNVVSLMSVPLRFAGADDAVRLDSDRLDRAPGAHLPASPRSVATRRLDRKSTRLNSSHANISYAVFCLKKKNKQD